MKKLLSLVLVAVMVLGFCAAATAADGLQGRAEELRALRTEIWTLISKPLPTAEDRARLETLKQEYEAKRWVGNAPAAAQEEPVAAVEADKAPACQACPAADMSCQPMTDKATCVCACPCCKDGVCTPGKDCCKKNCRKDGVCAADKNCCKAGVCATDKSCCKNGFCAADKGCSPKMDKCASCKKCPKADGKKCKKFGKRHGKRHGMKHGCKGLNCAGCAKCAPTTSK